ncbi:hypothetical protein FN846DRAFT_892258 [Sphaerosporella brunnea]|uniref:Restriction endonuclease domain-containing protein n=1 Tax=Sphaerosporella brunnea TaxID=1250544 RepID=A0A5J5EQZ8_9PEZI|nr:hypothetical protein FN846DRAFT_892258 [Sphaerosporella brunnea]
MDSESPSVSSSPAATLYQQLAEAVAELTSPRDAVFETQRVVIQVPASSDWTMDGGVHATACRWLQEHGNPVAHCEYHASQWYLRLWARTQSGPALILESPAMIHEIIPYESTRHIRNVLCELGFFPATWPCYTSGEAVVQNNAGQRFILHPNSSLMFPWQKVPWLVFEVVNADTTVDAHRKAQSYLFGTRGQLRYAVVVTLYNHDSYKRVIIPRREHIRGKHLVQDFDENYRRLQAGEEITQRMHEQPALRRFPHERDDDALLSYSGPCAPSRGSLLNGRNWNTLVRRDSRVIAAGPRWGRCAS